MLPASVTKGTLPPDHPPLSIPPDPSYSAVCAAHASEAGRPGRCFAEEVRATDTAREREGLGPLRLPSNFRALTAAEQIFVLTDIERADRGLQPYRGLAAALDASALVAARAGVDPNLPGFRVSGALVPSWASNWAEAFNALDANYNWMYDDGPGSENRSCRPGQMSGCWGHRDNILWQPVQPRLGCSSFAVGAAAVASPATGSGLASVTEIIALVSGRSPAYVYTWSQARAAGAG